MKKLKVLAGLSGFLLIAAGISCKTVPPQTEETQTDEPAQAAVQPAQPAADPDMGPPDQAALDSLAAARRLAEEARKRASDFGAPDYAPGDWETAETMYDGAVEQENGGSLKAAKESAGLFGEAAAVYDAAFGKALPQYAEALKKEILKARASALDAGIASISPERLQPADDAANKALNLYEAEDYYPALNAGRLALDMFGLLKTGAEAYTLRQEIENYGFRKYETLIYDTADSAALAAIAGYDSLPHDEEGYAAVGLILIKAEEARQGYGVVLWSGWKAYSAERRAAAEAERKNALDFKADVAVKNEYNSAGALYDKAGTSFNAERYNEAADLYFQSEFLFASAAGTAAEKRRIAEEAIREAEVKAEASDIIARKAEALLEGGGE